MWINVEYNMYSSRKRYIDNPWNMRLSNVNDVSSPFATVSNLDSYVHTTAVIARLCNTYLTMASCGYL